MNLSLGHHVLTDLALLRDLGFLPTASMEYRLLTDLSSWSRLLADVGCPPTSMEQFLAKDLTMEQFLVTDL
jgi:hypothetical protein